MLECEVAQMKPFPQDQSGAASDHQSRKQTFPKWPDIDKKTIKNGGLLETAQQTVDK